jgi:hypothetical protein
MDGKRICGGDHVKMPLPPRLKRTTHESALAPQSPLAMTQFTSLVVSARSQGSGQAATFITRTWAFDTDWRLGDQPASNFGQPYPGETVEQLLKTFPGYTISTENAYRAGVAMARYLMTHHPDPAPGGTG